MNNMRMNSRLLTPNNLPDCIRREIFSSQRNTINNMIAVAMYAVMFMFPQRYAVVIWH
jgi:hypothetical protein